MSNRAHLVLNTAVAKRELIWCQAPLLSHTQFSSEAGRAYPQRAVWTSAGLHSRRVEDNTPYLLSSGYAELGRSETSENLLRH